jgi:CRISPR-associated protein Csx14
VPETDALRVRLDPTNPGQFFACCGLLELISHMRPDAVAHFETDPRAPRAAWFTATGNGADAALTPVLTRLREATLTFPQTKGVEPSVNPAWMEVGGQRLVLDWWLNEFYTKNSNLKCWAGQVTTRNLLEELIAKLDAPWDGESLFERARMTKAKFGLDPRSAWNALDFGFSPNEHGTDAATFPEVEVLAAVGLQYFRPDSSNRGNVRYALWRKPLPCSIARLAFRSPWSGLPAESYRFEIRKRGQSYKYFTFAVRVPEGTQQ